MGNRHIALGLGGYNDLAAWFNLSLLGHSYSAVLINNIGMTLTSSVAEATSLLHIIFIVLAILKGHRIGGQYIACDTHSMVEARNIQTIAIHQLDVLRRAWMGKGLIKMDTNTVGVRYVKLIEVQCVLAFVIHTGHLDDFFHTSPLITGHGTNKTCTADIGTRNDATCCLDNI